LLMGGIFANFSKKYGGIMSEKVRRAVVAGMFYPADVDELNEMLDSYLESAEKVIHADIGGLVAPHAGYIYSGPVAAWAFKQVEGLMYPLVVVVSPSHFEYFNGASIYDGQFYETPLGRIPIAIDYAQRLSEQDNLIRLGEPGHRLLGGGRGEHSLEVELPFLQKVLKGSFQLIPIVVAEQDWSTARVLAEALANVFKNEKVLLVASSDLSHYYPYDTAYRLDEKLIQLFESFEYESLLERVARRDVEACGAGPIVSVMYACRLLGFSKARVVKYATSGDVPYGEKEQVVGYMAGVLYRES